MSMLRKEIVLTRTTACWPTFNQIPYDFDHFYRIAEREGIQVVIDSKPLLKLEEDFLPSESKNLISINANGNIPEGDSVLVQREVEFCVLQISYFWQCLPVKV